MRPVQMLLRSKSILRRKSAEGNGVGKSACVDIGSAAALLAAVQAIRDDYFSAEVSPLDDEGLPSPVRMQVKMAAAYRMAQTRSVNSPK